MAPVLAALGAMAALLTQVKVEIVRSDQSDDESWDCVSKPLHQSGCLLLRIPAAVHIFLNEKGFAVQKDYSQAFIVKYRCHHCLLPLIRLNYPLEFIH